MLVSRALFFLETETFEYRGDYQSHTSESSADIDFDAYDPTIAEESALDWGQGRVDSRDVGDQDADGVDDCCMDSDESDAPPESSSDEDINDQRWETCRWSTSA